MSIIIWTSTCQICNCLIALYVDSLLVIILYGKAHFFTLNFLQMFVYLVNTTHLFFCSIRPWELWIIALSHPFFSPNCCLRTSFVSSHVWLENYSARCLTYWVEMFVKASHDIYELFLQNMAVDHELALKLILKIDPDPCVLFLVVLLDGSWNWGLSSYWIWIQ